MNSETKDCCKCGTATAYTVAILGAFLIVAVLVWAMRQYMPAPALNAARAAERAKAFAQMRAAEAEAVNNVAWIDQGKGIVRLRVEDAVKMVEQQWGKDPAAGRKDLLDRVEKATAVPAPPPAQPSQFE